MKKKNKWKGLVALLLLGILAGTVLLTRKSGPEGNPAFLPGIYICLAQNEFCQITDTLVIRRTRNTEDDYSVTRSTSFVRIRAGKRDPPEFIQCHWIGRYDMKQLQLVPVEEGDTVRYDPEKNHVSKSNFYYEKIE